MGKIICTAVAGLLQMIIWLLPLMLLAGDTLQQRLPVPDFDLQVGVGVFAYFLLNYLIGLLTFLALFSAVGAMFDSRSGSLRRRCWSTWPPCVPASGSAARSTD